VAIALAIIQVVYTNHLARAGKKDVALRLDRWSRVVFPAALVLALTAAVVRAYTQTE
jgi:hypothetical protein